MKSEELHHVDFGKTIVMDLQVCILITATVAAGGDRRLTRER